MSRFADTLSGLFVTLFSAEELRRFLAPYALDADLPGLIVSQNDLASSSAAALERRGLVDLEFFERLIAERPRREAEIRRVRSELLPDSPLAPDAEWGGGRYQLLERIGEGGFAEVWKAIELETGEYVALKILHPNVADNPISRKRFVRGASAFVRLQHSGLAAVRGRASLEGSRVYCVLEYVPGDTLTRVVEHGQRTPAQLLSVIERVGEALAYVHSEGHAHRDVNPNNIVVTREGQAKLIDFDLVAGANFTSLTKTVPPGTIIYMAPELFDGDERSPAAADVYSLAMTTVFILLGGDVPAAKALRDPMGLLARLPETPALREVLRAALDEDVGRRTPSVRAFLDALSEAMEPARNGTAFRPATPEFAADGTLRLWSPCSGELPQPIAEAGVIAWPAETLDRVDQLAPHRGDLLAVATLLALRGHCAAWVGLTEQATPLLVMSSGHVVLQDRGPPPAADLTLARRMAREPEVPVAVVRAWHTGQPLAPGIIELARAIRGLVRHDERLLRLSRWSTSLAAHDSLELYARERPGEISTPLLLALSRGAVGPSVVVLRGPLGSGRTHSLRLYAAHLAQQARVHDGKPVVLIDARGWRPPLRLATLLGAAGYTPADCAALRFAVGAGQCELLVDGLDAPGEPLDSTALAIAVKAELDAWAGSAGHIVITFTSAYSLPATHEFRLGVTDTSAAAKFDEATDDPTRAAAIRQGCDRAGTVSLMHLPVLARPLLTAVRDRGDGDPVRLYPAIERYLEEWCEHASMLVPGVTSAQLRLALEAVAIALWSSAPEEVEDGLTDLLIDEVLHRVVGAHAPIVRRYLKDGAILVRAKRPTITSQWLASEAARLDRRPVEPYQSPGSRRVAKTPRKNLCFPHNTILEVLIAGHITRRLAAGDRTVLLGPRVSPNLARLCSRTRQWPDARAQLGAVLRAERHPEFSDNAFVLTTGDPTLTSTREQPWQLAGARLGGAVVPDARLTGADLRGADLTGADLRRAELTAARLDGADLSRADLREVILDHASAVSTTFIGARLDGIMARAADIRGAHFFASTAPHASPDFTGAQVAGADFDGTLWRLPVGLARPRLAWWSPEAGSFAAAAETVTELLDPAAFARQQHAAWTPDGRAVISIDASGTICMWSARPLRPLRRWQAARRGKNRVALTHDGALLATWSEGHAVRVWSMTSGSEMEMPLPLTRPAHGAAWARTARVLALFAGDGSVWLWHVATGRTHEVASLISGSTDGCFSPDDTRLLVWSRTTGNFALIDLATNRIVAECTVAPEYLTPGSIAVSRDGRHVALRYNQELVFLDVAEGLAPRPPIEDPKFASWAALDWSPDGSSLILGYVAGAPSLWQTASHQWSHHLADSPYELSYLRFSPDGASILGIRPDTGDLVVWDAGTGRRIEERFTQTWWIQAVAITPDRRNLLAYTGRELRRWSLPDCQEQPRQSMPRDSAVVLLPDASGSVLQNAGELVLADLQGVPRRVLDRRTDGTDHWLEGHTTCDGRYFVGRAGDNVRGEVTVWELATGQRTWSRPASRDEKRRVDHAYAVAVPLDVGIFAGHESTRQLLEVWSRDGVARRVFPENRAVVHRLAVDARGHFLATADQAGLVELWDLPKWTAWDGRGEPPLARLQLGELARETDTIERLLFAPDSSMLAVASGDGISLYSAVERTRLRRFDGRGARILSLAFSVEGRLLVAGDASGLLRLWRVDTGELVVTVHVVPSGNSVATRGVHHGHAGPGTMSGWYAGLDTWCVPLELFDDALAAPDVLEQDCLRLLEDE